VTAERFQVIVVDDEENLRNVLAKAFPEEEFLVATACDGEDALARIRDASFHAAIVDFMMPNMNGIELLAKVREVSPRTAVFILTAYGSIESAVEAMRAGAYDYLTKPFRLEEVREKVRRACAFRSLEEENLRLKAELRDKHRFRNLIGASPAMLRVFEIVDRVSDTDNTVLLLGESGTGKEQVARAIHFSGARADNPFVPVDCGAINPNLIESELFGHVRGAFTGANAASDGILRSAGRGTIFLDEVGELPLGVQAKLLRALQERQVRPVGGIETFPLRARIVAATNKDIDRAVREKTFREDLYYRLAVVIVKLPPLRERAEDVSLLVQSFLGETASEGRPVKKMSLEASKVLKSYSWPGNVRELRNAVESAAALTAGDVIGPDDLPEKVRSDGNEHFGAGTGAVGDGSMKSYERVAIVNALKSTGGNRKESARILGIAETTLYRKLKEFDLG